MGCNCKWTETILALVILVFAIWPSLIPQVQGSWIIIVAAVLLLIHAWTCKNCGTCIPETTGKVKVKKK